MIRLALIYAALMGAVIVAADVGFLPRFVEYLHDLPYGDKVMHFLMFGGLALVANLALASRGQRSLARAIVIGSILVLALSTAEECSNRFVSRRDWSVGDLTANYLGVVCLGMLPLLSRPRFLQLETSRPDESLGPQDADER